MSFSFPWFARLPVFRLIACLAVSLFLVVGCNSKNIVELTPPKAGFSASSFKITYQRSQEDYEVASKDQLLSFERELRNCLLDQGKNAKLPQGDDMEIRYAVAQYDEGSRMVRWLVPGVAGQAKLSVDVNVVSKDGEVVGHFLTNVEMTGFMSGGGGSADEAFGDAARKTAKYIGQKFMK